MFLEMMFPKSSFIIQEEPGEFSLKQYQGHFCMSNIGVFRTGTGTGLKRLYSLFL